MTEKKLEPQLNADLPPGLMEEFDRVVGTLGFPKKRIVAAALAGFLASGQRAQIKVYLATIAQYYNVDPSVSARELAEAQKVQATVEEEVQAELDAQGRRQKRKAGGRKGA